MASILPSAAGLIESEESGPILYEVTRPDHANLQDSFQVGFQATSPWNLTVALEGVSGCSASPIAFVNVAGNLTGYTIFRAGDSSCSFRLRFQAFSGAVKKAETVYASSINAGDVGNAVQIWMNIAAFAAILCAGIYWGNPLVMAGGFGGLLLQAAPDLPWNRNYIVLVSALFVTILALPRAWDRQRAWLQVRKEEREAKKQKKRA